MRRVASFCCSSRDSSAVIQPFSSAVRNLASAGRSGSRKYVRTPPRMAWNTLQNQQPPPTADIQTNGRDPESHRTAELPTYAGYRIGGTEQSDGVSKLPLAKPVRQIEHDSGKESGLSHPEQKAHNIQVDSCFHEASQHRHDSPTYQYACRSRCALRILCSIRLLGISKMK